MNCGDFTSVRFRHTVPKEGQDGWAIVSKNYSPWSLNHSLTFAIGSAEASRGTFMYLNSIGILYLARQWTIFFGDTVTQCF